MSAMKNVAIAMEEVLIILDDLPEAQRVYLVKHLEESDAQRRADNLGIDVPSQFTAAEFMNRNDDRKTVTLPGIGTIPDYYDGGNK